MASTFLADSADREARAAAARITRRPSAGGNCDRSAALSVTSVASVVSVEIGRHSRQQFVVVAEQVGRAREGADRRRRDALEHRHQLVPDPVTRDRDVAIGHVLAESFAARREVLPDVGAADVE